MKLENSNNSNKNKNRNKSKPNNIDPEDKDAEIRKLRIALREITEKYNKMKLENDKLKKKIKATPSKASNSTNSKALDLTKIKKKYLKKWSARLPKLSAMKKTKFMGFSKEIIVEEMGFDKEEFDAIFG